MGGTFSARAIARLLSVCGVLAGVFLMHALPAQACAGGAMPGSAMTAAPGPMRHVGHSAALGAPAGTGTLPSLTTRGLESGHGNVCVSTSPPRGVNGLIALLLLAAAGAFVVTTRLPDQGGRPRRARHRGPPRAGSALLTTLCVSRT